MSAEKTLLEKAFNDARKQISMLGEKEVQMTDYLIQPKYKTFEDWYTKQSKQEEVKCDQDNGLLEALIDVQSLILDQYNYTYGAFNEMDHVKGILEKALNQNK